MPVGQPKFLEDAALLGQQRPDFHHDIPGRIHQHRLAKLCVGQQVADGLDRTGREHMNLHARQTE